MLIGHARVSRADDQDTLAQVQALKGARCHRVYEEKASGGRTPSRSSPWSPAGIGPASLRKAYEMLRAMLDER